MLKKSILILLLIPMGVLSQHTIKGIFSPAKSYNYALLYRITPTTHNYVANAEIIDGKFNFELDSTITKGIYKLVYALPQEEYNFEFIYSAKEDIVLSFNQETGVNYIKSFDNILLSSYSHDMDQINQSIGNYFLRSTYQDTTMLMNFFKKKLDIQNTYENKALGSLALPFIKAKRSYIPADNNFDDYLKNLKEDYFLHVDFNDEILQSSSFLSDLISNYVFGLDNYKNNNLSTYREHIDDVYIATKEANFNIKISLIAELWQQMVDLNLDTTANYIADNYLLDLSEKYNISELTSALKNFKNSSIGSFAPDFLLKQASGDDDEKISLRSLNTSQEYIIVFWSSSCSYCLEEIPQLKTFFKTKNKDKLQIIAIGLEDRALNWNSLIVSYPEFIHVLALGKWTNKIASLYHVNTTPSYFILNKEKKIISKPANISELITYFEN